MNDDITVLISSSPIISHPSTAIIDETIRSIRYQLPDSKILIMLDGVRPEQEHHRANYEEYRMRLAAKILDNWDINIAMWPFASFRHQANMAMEALTEVHTPLIVFVEADIPFLDRQIDWPMLKDAVLSGATNHIRFHLDEQIHPDHEFLMDGKLTQHLIKTRQWSQRIHLANTDWYAAMLRATFTKDSRTFIEDKIYGVVCSAPWETHRLTIYDPNGDGKQMKRSGDLNGRNYEPKYDLIF